MPTLPVDLEDAEFDLLADYSVRHGATMADAMRYAIYLMLSAERLNGEKRGHSGAGEGIRTPEPLGTGS